MPRKRTDTCASCLRRFETPPVFQADRVYCCGACAAGHLCSCMEEVDLAQDGVDGLGLLFALDDLPVGQRAGVAE